MKMNFDFWWILPPDTDVVIINRIGSELIKLCRRANYLESSAEYYLAKLGLLDLCNRLWDFYRFVKMDQTIDQLSLLVKSLPSLSRLVHNIDFDPQDRTVHDLVLYKILHNYKLVSELT